MIKNNVNFSFVNMNDLTFPCYIVTIKKYKLTGKYIIDFKRKNNLLDE